MCIRDRRSPLGWPDHGSDDDLGDQQPLTGDSDPTVDVSRETPDPLLGSATPPDQTDLASADDVVSRETPDRELGSATPPDQTDLASADDVVSRETPDPAAESLSLIHI